MLNYEAAESAEHRERAWAIVRIAQGMIQVVGATATAFWFTTTSVNSLSLGGLAVTTFALMASRLLFRD